MTAYDVLKERDLISRDVLACEIDGELCELTHEVSGAEEIKPLTFEDAGGKKCFWHTTSHIMAQAVKRIMPDVKLTIGPSIDNGFYYDFDAAEPFTPETLENIEAEMKKIVKENLRLERFTLPRGEAVKFMKEKNEPYKVELINDLPEGETISFYRQGEFTDLCAGPHLVAPGAV